MRSLARIGLILLYVAAFFVITGLLGKGHSYLTAESYVPGAAPRGNFPVVGVRRGEPASTGTQYQLMQWSEIEKNRRSAAPLTFKLPEPHGYFRLPIKGDFQPAVDFKVIETAGDRQVIAVTWMEEDYVFYSKYNTDGSAVSPVSLRIWGASSMMIALIPGLVVTWLLGRTIAWAWNRRSRT